MAASVLQVTYAGTFDATSAGTQVITLNGVTLGSTLLLDVTWDSSGGASINNASDGTVYTALPKGVVVDAGNGQSSQCFKLENASAGTHSVTVSFSIACSFRCAALIEVGGVVASSSVDKDAGQTQTNGGTGTDAFSSSASAATTNANDIVIGFLCRTGGGRTADATAGTGFALEGSAHSLKVFSVESKQVSVTGAQTATFTLATDGATADSVTFVVALIASSPSVYAPPPRLPLSQMLLPGTPGNQMRAFFRPPPVVSITAGNTFSDSVAESVAFADAQTAQVDFSVTRAESVAFTDAQTGQVDFSVMRAESVAFTDAQTAGTSLATVQRDESIAFADSQTGVFAISGQVDESVAFTDSQSSNATFSSQRDESISFTDAQTASAQFSVTEAESIAFTDSQTGAALFSVQRDESVAFTDSQDATITAGGSNQVDEAVAFADAQSAQTDFAASIAESISFTDSQTGTKAGDTPPDLGGGFNHGTVAHGPFAPRLFAARSFSAHVVAPIVQANRIARRPLADAVVTNVHAERKIEASAQKPTVMQLVRTGSTARLIRGRPS